MDFSQVAARFDELESIRSRTIITNVLAELLQEASPEEAQIVAYLSLGELYPVYIGTQFNFAEKSMYHFCARLTGQSLESVKAGIRVAGDIASWLKKQSWEHSATHVSVIEIYQALKVFSELSGTGSHDAKEDFLLDLFKKVDANSAAYIVRIIMQKLRLGFSDMTLLDAFSVMYAGDKSLRRALEDAYNVSADIGNLVYVLKKYGMSAINSMVIVPGVPILPSLAERLSDAQAIIDKLGPCVSQPKLDGFRLQVHRYEQDGKVVVRFFSRNLQEMSSMFPELLDAVKKIKGTSFIFEGEAIAHDIEAGAFLPFQETSKRRRKHGIEEMSHDFPLKLYLFDFLYQDGISLLDMPHTERRQKLVTLGKQNNFDEKSPIHVLEEIQTPTIHLLEGFFEHCISEGLEGVVVKKPDSTYKPGKRNFNWVKLKRQETGELSDTLDCVILGYCAGKGRRAAFGIGALLIGVYNKEKDCFETIAKIGTGLTDDEWKAQKIACDQRKLLHQPHNVSCAKELYPHVWVAPEIVCSIRADEITRSPLHQAGARVGVLGYALRFPRLMGYREDKAAIDATTTHEVESLYSIQMQKSRKTKS